MGSGRNLDLSAGQHSKSLCEAFFFFFLIVEIFSLVLYLATSSAHKQKCAHHLSSLSQWFLSRGQFCFPRSHWEMPTDTFGSYNWGGGGLRLGSRE